MTRTPKPGDRLLPKIPHGKIHAVMVNRLTVSDSRLTYARAPEVRITTSVTYPDGVAVAMWEGTGKNACYIPVQDLDPDTYVFSDEIDDSRPASTVTSVVTPNDLGKLVRVSGREKTITGYLVGINASMNPIYASHPIPSDVGTEICLRSVSHREDTTTVRIYSDDQIEFLDKE